MLLRCVICQSQIDQRLKLKLLLLKAMVLEENISCTLFEYFHIWFYVFGHRATVRLNKSEITESCLDNRAMPL